MPSIIKSRGVVPLSENVVIPEYSLEYRIENGEIIFESLDGENIRMKVEENLDEEIDETEEREQETQGEFVEAYVHEDIVIGEEISEETEHETVEVQKEPPQLTEEDIKELYKDEFLALAEEAKEEAYKKAYEDAYRTAYREAIAKRKGELEECVKGVDKSLDRLQKDQQEFMVKYANELKFLAIDVAEKMIMQKINEDEMILEKLVVSTISGIKKTSWFDVEISENLVGLVEKIRKDLEMYHGIATVTPISGENDIVRVNTEESTVVNTISTQAENLRKLFENS